MNDEDFKKLLQIAENMYIVLINEIGYTSVSKEYKEFIEYVNDKIQTV